ncbi:matrix metalloproteinase-25 isoform X1 [Prionailurus iriomotensis]
MLGLLALLLPLLPPPARAQEPSAQDVSLGVDWLTRYGYLPPPHPAQAQLQSPAKLRDAIKVMQRFAGLPETGLLDPVTMATMHRPRCSLPDVLGAAELVRRRRRRRRYALSGSVWKKRTLTWRVHSFPQSSALSQEMVRTLMHHALTTWGVESGLKFQEVGFQSPTEPDIVIDFARAYHQDSYPFDGQGGTLAHAFFPGEHSISGDTHFDDEEIWTYGSKEPRQSPSTPYSKQPHLAWCSAQQLGATGWLSGHTKSPITEASRVSSSKLELRTERWESSRVQQLSQKGNRQLLHTVMRLRKIIAEEVPEDHGLERRPAQNL